MRLPTGGFANGIDRGDLLGNSANDIIERQIQVIYNESRTKKYSRSISKNRWRSLQGERIKIRSRATKIGD
jgi:hypothetical protein